MIDRRPLHRLLVTATLVVGGAFAVSTHDVHAANPCSVLPNGGTLKVRVPTVCPVSCFGSKSGDDGTCSVSLCSHGVCLASCSKDSTCVGVPVPPGVSVPSLTRIF